MGASFDLLSEPVPLARSGVAALVFRYVDKPPVSDGEEETVASHYQWLPHVHVLEIVEQDANNPWTARFKYVFDDEVMAIQIPGLPKRIEDVFGLDRPGPNVLTVNDRIAVGLWDLNRPYDPPLVAFDGFPVAPQADLSDGNETATFEANGYPVLFWDLPIVNGLWRNANKALLPGENEVVWGVNSCRFNPEGKGNCTLVRGPVDPENEEGAGEEGALTATYRHPCFIDLSVRQSKRQKWTLDGAFRYLLYYYMPTREDSEGKKAPIINVPKDKELKRLLVARVPKEGSEADYDPSDPDTWTEEPIEINDFDATGMTLPDALQSLLDPYGFGFRFNLYRGDFIGSDAAPDWFLQVYRKDVRTPRKDVFLQPPGQQLAPHLTNVGSLSVQRDGDVANAWTALTEPARLQAAFILYPNVEPDPEDAAEDRAKFKFGARPEFIDKYRNWVFGEDGGPVAQLFDDGKYGATGSFPDGLTENLLFTREGDPERKFVVRGRPGTDHLTRPTKPTADEVDEDGNVKEWRARLFVVTVGQMPEVPERSEEGAGFPGIYGLDVVPADPKLTPTEKFQEAFSGWELLRDRLGVRITTEDLMDWNLGTPPDEVGDDPLPAGGGGTIDILTRITVPDANNPAFALVLVTEIELDWTIAGDTDVSPRRRASSPLTRTVERADEVRDRFRAVYFLNDTDGISASNFKQVDRQKERLKWHLTERRSRHEMASVAGSITIPRIVYTYALGDRIHGVYGRGLRFHMNATPDPADKGIFPAVVAIRRTFQSEFSTTIELHDRRADALPVPKRYK